MLTKKVKPQQEETEYRRMVSCIEKDEIISQEDADLFKRSKARVRIPEETLIAFQMRHNDKLIFSSREELEEMASRVLRRKVTAEEVLARYRLYDEFAKKTGMTIGHAIMYTSDSPEHIAFIDEMDYVLRHIHEFDVFHLERIVTDLEKKAFLLEKASPLPKKQYETLTLLKAHLSNARKEVLQWAKRGFRTDRTLLDVVLGRRFIPRYKLPEKSLLKTEEGEKYLSALKEFYGGKKETASLMTEEFVKNLELILIAKDTQLRQLLHLEKESQKEVKESIDAKTGKEHDRNEELNENRGEKRHVPQMKLSELKFDNIQEGKVQEVSGMSNGLIACAQQITEKLISDDNPESINPLGKNKALESRRERLESNHNNALNRTLQKWIAGYGAKKGRSAGLDFQIQKKN